MLTQIKRLVFNGLALFAGAVLVIALTTPVAAQQGSLLFGTFSGAMKPLSVTTDGYINIALPNGSLDFGAAGVRLSGDGDGAITFLGLGNGTDEDLTINLDDVSNEISLTSSTGAITWDANFQIFKFGDATTAAQYVLFDNDDTSDVYVGIESAAGGGVFTGSTTDSAVFGTGGAKNLHLGTNSTVRMTIYSAINSWNLPPQATVPASPVSGDFYVDSSPAPDELCFYDGTGWQGISSGTDANCA